MKKNLYLRLPLTPTSDLLSSFGPQIPEHYLNGIIWRCDLFDPEEGGVFMPKEFDFPCKKEEKATPERPDSQTRKAAKATPEKLDFQAKSDEKTAKNAPEKPVSLQKSDEKQQKMSGNESGNQPEIPINELNFKHLRENSTEINKNTTIYYINITTTSSTEEKEEAAAEDVFSSSKRASAPFDPRHVPISKPIEESAPPDAACMTSGKSI